VIRRVIFFAAALLIVPAARSGETAGNAATLRAGSFTLESAISLALKQNPEILKSRYEIERTRGQVIEVRAQALPLLANTAQYTQLDPDSIQSGGNRSSFDGTSNSFILQDKSWKITFEARQTLYSGGKVRAALKIAAFEEDASIQLLRETVARVIANVRTQFYTALLNRELITVAGESIQLLGDELKDQQNRFSAGTVPRFNVLRAEVELANARPELIRSRNNFLISRLELAKTLGLDEQATINVVGQLLMPPRELNLSQALVTARKSRAILKARVNSVGVEQQQITVARAGYKPTLDARLGYGFENAQNDIGLGEVVDGWYFGFVGSWNIFDGFQTKGRVKQAQARLASAEVDLSDSERQVELEVQRAYAKVNEAREVIASQSKVVEQADEALRLSRERLAAGAGTQLDVLDARVALTRARTTQKTALADYNVALAEYDRAIGAETIHDYSLPALKRAPVTPPVPAPRTRRADLIGAD